MIVITAAASPVGQSLMDLLSLHMFRDIVASDSREMLSTLRIREAVIPRCVESATLPSWIDAHHRGIQFIADLAGKASQSRMLWGQSVRYGLPYLYLCGEETFDAWVQQQEEKPYFWAGLEIQNMEEKNIAEAIYHLMLHRKGSGIHRVNWNHPIEE